MWSITSASRRDLLAPGRALAALAALAGGAAAGCTSKDVGPDPLQLFFPTGAVISPDGERLFVTNANSDLAYSSGSISILPLPAVEDAVARWLASGEIPQAQCDDDNDEGDDPDHPCCDRDRDFAETIVCDEDLFLGATRRDGVQIGSFASDVAIQELGNGDLRLIVPTRGDPSIAWADLRAGGFLRGA